jgi:hypothetical protein
MRLASPHFAPVLLAPALLILSGCGQAGARDPVAALDVLRAALDAWKDGQTTDVLKARGTSISDPQWQSGFKLARYEIGNDPRPAGFDVNYPAELWMTDGNGRSVCEKAVFTVSTHPAPTVVRAAFDKPPEPLASGRARRSGRPSQTRSQSP